MPRRSRLARGRSSCARVQDVRSDQIEHADLVVVGNAERAPTKLLRHLSDVGRHVLFEHDVRICRWRGDFPTSRDPIHALTQRCWCPHHRFQRLFASALGVIFLTHRQRRVYERNPFYRGGRNAVLGCSLFGTEFFERVAKQGAKAKSGQTVVFNSRQRIKGAREAMRYCAKNAIEPLSIRDLTPNALLDVLERSARFVYLPIALEPAGRMPVEARLLGCEVVVNENVGVAGEDWWFGARETALDFLRDGPSRFWRLVESFLNHDRRDKARSSRWLLPAEVALWGATVPIPARVQSHIAARFREEVKAETYAPWTQVSDLQSASSR
jgi:hypothetical protein